MAVPDGAAGRAGLLIPRTHPVHAGLHAPVTAARIVPAGLPAADLVAATDPDADPHAYADADPHSHADTLHVCVLTAADAHRPVRAGGLTWTP
jgi:hypothetical protein